MNLLPNEKTDKLLILFKVSKLDNQIHKLTDMYCEKYKNYIDYYYLCSDETITENVEIANNIIKIKIKEDNWSSLLLKVIYAFSIFKNYSYSNVMVSNISTFLNIPVLLNIRDTNTPCLSYKGYYTFKNIKYSFPSGAGYIFNMEIVNIVCNFFSKNKFIESNRLTNDFCNNYPTTDDIFFGYFFYLNKINIKELNRYDILGTSSNINSIPANISHIRVKTGNYVTDCKYYNALYNKLYT